MSDDQVDIVQIVVIAEETVWDNHLKSFMQSQNHDFILSHDMTNAEQQITSDCTCVIISHKESETLKLTQVLKSNHPELFVICVWRQDMFLLLDDEVFDAMVSLKTPFWSKQLANTLKMFLEGIASKTRIAALEDEMRLQKRLTSEIEVIKNAIVRNVSHELRTPLLQVKSAVSLLKEEAHDKKLLSYAENATARLETHVTNITMLGHSLDISLNPIILRDAIEYARRNLKRIWERKSQADRIELQIEDGLLPVLADKQGLSTVLQLLMDNALKFSEGSIRVSARKDGDKIRISVQDFGIGIASDKLQDIFESFYQIDNSSTRRYGGAGVGLALVKLILDYHNTDIRVESVVGEGSTFSFVLPYVDI